MVYSESVFSQLNDGDAWVPIGECFRICKSMRSPSKRNLLEADSMKRSLTYLSVFLSGFGAAYLLRLERDWTRAGGKGSGDIGPRESSRQIDPTSLQILSRLNRLILEIKSVVAGDNAPEEALRQRVMAQLDRHGAGMADIAVFVHEGTVSMAGRLPQSEIQPLVSAVHRIPGVNQVINQLAEDFSEVHRLAFEDEASLLPSPSKQLFLQAAQGAVRKALAPIGLAAGMTAGSLLLLGWDGRRTSAGKGVLAAGIILAMGVLAASRPPRLPISRHPTFNNPMGRKPGLGHNRGQSGRFGKAYRL